jgi:hypothetical protein
LIATVSTHNKPEERDTTPSSVFFVERNVKPSELVPAATEATAIVKKRNKERREIMLVRCVTEIVEQSQVDGHCRGSGAATANGNANAIDHRGSWRNDG